MRGIALATSIGVPFGALVSFGALAGHHFDEKTGRNVFTPVGVVLGALAAMVNMIRVIKYFQRTDEPPPDDPTP